VADEEGVPQDIIEENLIEKENKDNEANAEEEE